MSGIRVNGAFGRERRWVSAVLLVVYDTLLYGRFAVRVAVTRDKAILHLGWAKLGTLFVDYLHRDNERRLGS
jgi:hypothetical protein